ncbi:hypothetical protein [Glaciihabitans arcticus]|nr:hypothetical protein [Glaciihabitans arcticus]
MSDHPELDGYEPMRDKPLRSPHLQMVMRVVVVLALVGLILPGIIVTWTTASATATRTCGTYAGVFAPTAEATSVRFELFGPEGPGWNCYVREFGGAESLLRALGLIPGAAIVPSGELGNS